jgi:hypothetical protein
VPRPAVLLDSNLLLLYVVGLASPEYIARHRRLSAYSRHGRRAFGILFDYVSWASALLVTPNVLTEVSNLLGGRERDDVVTLAILDVFKWLIRRAEERNTSSAAAAARLEFPRLGLADAATLEVLGADAMLLTDDVLLYDAALRAGKRAELFSYRLTAARLS